MAQARRARAAQQRLFLMSDSIGRNEIKYEVMGSTGNIYTVKFHKSDLTEYGEDGLTCTCPDFERRQKACKHCFFVLSRVIGAPKMSTSLAKRAEWVENVWALARARSRSTTFEPAPDVVLEEFSRLKKGGKKRKRAEADDEVRGVQQRPYVGQPCGVCMDEFVEGDDVVYCKTTCGNSVHRQCYDMWARRNPNQCVYCRKEMDFANPPKRAPASDTPYLHINRDDFGLPSEPQSTGYYSHRRGHWVPGDWDDDDYYY